jgi:hypothetical protein
MSNGQMLEDVKLALNGARPVEFFSRLGGIVPSHEEVLRFVRNRALRYLAGALPALELEEERLANV